MQMHYAHYTTWAGLHGILSKNHIRATSPKFTNDSIELRYGMDLAVHYLFRDLDLDNEENKKLFNRWQRYLYDFCYEKTLMFISSFCMHKCEQTLENGRLSQWRGYAKGGFAIVFDQKRMDELLDDEFVAETGRMFSLTDEVQYGELAKKTKDALDDIKGQLMPIIQSGEPDEEVLTKATKIFTHASVFSKDKSFEEESEWRVCVAYPFHKQGFQKDALERVDFFERRDAGVPFVKVFEGRLCDRVTGVLVGPHESFVHRTLAAQMLVRKYCGDGVRAYHSKIPYIG